jgi:putative ABC transport system permease protein
MYTTYTRAIAWAPHERRVLMYVHVKAADGVAPQELADRIKKQTGLEALTNDQYDRRSTKELLERTGILINFGITIVLGFVIGLLVAGQTFYTFVLDNLKLFGTLKAMGATNWMVVRMMCLQVIVVGLVGYGIGLGAASVVGRAMKNIGLAFYMTWQIPIVGGIAVVLCCLVAGLIGMIRVVRLEPAIVFKT